MKEPIWVYYSDVEDAVDTLVTMAGVAGGLSLAYVDALKEALRVCKNSRHVQSFFTGIRKRRPELLRLFVDFIPDSME